jgi:hypothetical protein
VPTTARNDRNGGAPPDTATRDQAALNQITSFLNSKVSGPRQ